MLLHVNDNNADEPLRSVDLLIATVVGDDNWPGISECGIMRRILSYKWKQEEEEGGAVSIIGDRIVCLWHDSAMQHDVCPVAGIIRSYMRSPEDDRPLQSIDAFTDFLADQIFSDGMLVQLLADGRPRIFDHRVVRVQPVLRCVDGIVCVVNLDTGSHTIPSSDVSSTRTQ